MYVLMHAICVDACMYPYLVLVTWLGKLAFRTLKLGLLIFKMCDSCRLVVKVNKCASRKQVNMNKIEFTYDEKAQLPLRPRVMAVDCVSSKAESVS